jgi:hypothetical protein
MQKGLIPVTRNVGISFQEDSKEMSRSFRYQSSNERSGVARIVHRCMQGTCCKSVDTHWLPEFRIPRDESKAGTIVSMLMSIGNPYVKLHNRLFPVFNGAIYGIFHCLNMVNGVSLARCHQNNL